ncbi:MAG: molybdopterin-dependent oxidoreductase [Deltaproteobacteria bacterium]|nr:molybdopterin-dependent oxidoreductase [Deltaproteobacteria bacterium]MBW2419215.1 molybdopterin-dependent oxidoreductase [Deltaproteobacteria bacterium]
MPREITRRRFLEGSAGLLALSLAQLRCREEPGRSEHVSTPLSGPRPYHGWGDVYRAEWAWDRIAKGTHHGNCWYQRCCNWNVYVKDGIVWREEQAGTYPQTNAEVPDFNPRGCQKGACFSERMYDVSRLRHPLRRVGERGEGQWKRISWDEALGEIGDRCVDALAQEGPDAILWDEGSGGSNIGVQRTHALLDTPILDLDSEFGDHHPGAAVTCGKISFCSSADDLFYSDLILIWGGNPTYTQIPNAHFINEARYHGAQVVTITPDYNPSAIHADRWIPVEIASDAALGLSLAHVMVEEGIYDAGFVSEQTDLPLLVRSDTRRFLRGSDMEEGGEDDRFFVYDRARGGVALAPKDSLALDGLDPALDGEYRVSTREGEVKVVPVFTLLRERLADYSPEAAQSVTGVPPKTVRWLARALAKARAASCLTQSNFGKFYHGLEMERAQFLAFALAGQFGRKGSGIDGFPMLWLSGHEGLMVGSGKLPPKLGLVEMGLPVALDVMKMKWKGYTPDGVMYELMRRRHKGGGQPSSVLFLHEHGGLEEELGGAADWDPALPRKTREYLAEAFAEERQIQPRKRPRVFFEVGGNYLRRNRAYPKILEELWPKLELVVTMDWRMSFTAMHSDIVLPAAGYYEDDSVPWTTPIAPFAHVTTRAVSPVGESKSDWDFHCLFAKALQDSARKRGVASYEDRSGEARSLEDIYERFTFQGRCPEGDSEALVREAVSLADNLGGIGWDELKEKGFHRYEDLGGGYMNIGNAMDVEPEETLTANSWHTEKKHPWPTLSRRMQFYIDHDLYFELGEELPVHKDNPPIGGDHPLQLTSGHTRWSVHAAWRDELNLLRLQRGEPVLMIGPEDARDREIEDGDRLRVFNDLNTFDVQAKVSPTMRPGQVVVYHAWEPFQFAGHKSQQALTPSPINPIQLAGGYLHLQPRMAVGTPGPSDRGTRVEVRKLGRDSAAVL